MAILMVAPATAQETKPDEKLPNAEALLQKMVKALGGEATIRKHKHQTLTGTFEIPAQGMSAVMTVHQAAPDLRHVAIEVPSFGQILSGYDGKVAWRDGPPAGPQVLDGKQREQAVRQADYFSNLNYQKNFKTIETTGKTEFNGKTCYELKLTAKNGDQQQLFIDAETHLPVGSVATLASPQGDLEVTSTYEEYKEFDGEMILVKTRADIGGFVEQIVTISEVSFEPFDHAVFELPESIKALLEDG